MKNYFFFIILMTIVFGTYSWTMSASREINVVALGDSITYGTGDSKKMGYIERVRTQLEEKEGLPVFVKNYGVPRLTSENILEKLKDNTVQEEIKRANYIFLYIGTNDFRKWIKPTGDKLIAKNMMKGKTIFSQNLKKILGKLRSENSLAEIYVFGLYHPYTEFENQHEILDVIELWNHEMVNTSNNFEDTYFIPTLDLFLNKPKKEYFQDKLHPNSEGYQSIADRAMERIIEIEKNKHFS
ncbi:GDSL-type esterase/lipase family protein [Robertmurraya sp. Marseille-Q9965]